MRISSAVQALVLLLAITSPAWADPSDAQTKVLLVESKELALIWPKGIGNSPAIVRCAGTANHSEISNDCRLLNSMGIILSGADLDKARTLGNSTYTSQVLQDARYHGTWIVSFSPGQTPAVRPNFYGFNVFLDAAGRLINAIPISATEADNLRGRSKIPATIRVGNLEITGYDHNSMIYRSIK